MDDRNVMRTFTLPTYLTSIKIARTLIQFISNNNQNALTSFWYLLKFLAMTAVLILVAPSTYPTLF